METEKELILTIGLPYSGKTNWCRNYGSPIINPDSIRLAMHGQRFVPEAEDLVWAMAKIMTRTLFFAGHNRVTVDACNSTEKRRDFWIDPYWKRRYIVLDVHADVCIERAREAEDEDIVPVIERMAYNLEYDGVIYNGTQSDKMSNHIAFPKGKELQTYHSGSAND